MDILLNDFNDYSLWLVSKKNLPNISQFILKVNHQFHLKSNHLNHKDLIKTTEADLACFSSSYFYTIKNRKHEIIGSIKAQRWDNHSILPLEEDFNIKLCDLVKNLPFTPPEVWHIGRFAIDQEKIKTDPILRKHRISFLKVLLSNAFKHFIATPNNIAIAECDKKLFQKLKLLQINSTEIGQSKIYLGSETVPILNTAKGVEIFIKTNENLCYPKNKQNLQSA